MKKAPLLASLALAAAAVFPGTSEAGARISRDCDYQYQIGANTFVHYEYNRSGAAKVMNDRTVQSWFFRTAADVNSLNASCSSSKTQHYNYQAAAQRQQQARQQQQLGGGVVRGGNVYINPNGGGRANINIGGINLSIGF